MAIQIGTVDGLITISKDNINCFTNAIYNFAQQGGVDFAIDKGISLGAAFQRYVEPVYTNKSKDFNIASIAIPAYTKGGNEQSPARGTFCRKMGLLDIKDYNHTFQLTPIALELYCDNITTEEYAFILMTKQGIFKDGVYVENLFTFISQWFEESATISETALKSKICELYNDENVEKTRIDIILNALAFCGLITNVGQGKYVLASIYAADVFRDFALQGKNISKALRDDDSLYTEYIGSFDNGIFDIISARNLDIYTHLYPNIHKYIKQRTDRIYQTIYYGCPGSGKSHKVKKDTEGVNTDFVFRTTFHPDTDYASFVGCYKPSMNEGNIEYSYSAQVFTNAYVQAWMNPDEKVYLIIEEINRGNCAQIFGDLFQLLDRDKNTGVSEYPVKADKDLADYLKGVLGADHEGIKDSELRLPSNLIIYATMNTSDQSLFPMDSAFKRRWDWEYVPIEYGADKESYNYIITIGDKPNEVKYRWVDFLEVVNKKIYDTTRSEDKQMGNFFIKKSVNAQEFINKVMFYLWNEVCKEEVGTSRNFFRIAVEGNNEGKEFKFVDLFDKANTNDLLIGFMNHLKVGEYTE